MPLPRRGFCFLMPKWWNGRHARLRGVWRKPCGFKSRLRHQLTLAHSPAFSCPGSNRDQSSSGLIPPPKPSSWPVSIPGQAPLVGLPVPCETPPVVFNKVLQQGRNTRRGAHRTTVQSVRRPDGSWRAENILRIRPSLASSQHWASERCGIDGGGLFQHPAGRTALPEPKHADR